jgi:two-component system NarL family response regulator
VKKLRKLDEIKVMLVDDHPAFRKGLAALLASEPGLRVIAETGDGREALALYRQKKPDVVLMDLRLPGMGGVEATLAIRNEFPEARIIVLTTFDTDEDIYRAIQSGASSYLLKDTPDEELSATIRAVFAGQHPLPVKVAERLALRQKRSDLSQREMDVLQLLTKGRSNKEIGASLFISEDTVKAHLKTLFTKLQVQDRTEAAITAIRQGIVHLECPWRGSGKARRRALQVPLLPVVCRVAWERRWEGFTKKAGRPPFTRCALLGESEVLIDRRTLQLTIMVCGRRATRRSWSKSGCVTPE